MQPGRYDARRRQAGRRRHRRHHRREGFRSGAGRRRGGGAVDPRWLPQRVSSGVAVPDAAAEGDGLRRAGAGGRLGRGPGAARVVLPGAAQVGPGCGLTRGGGARRLGGCGVRGCGFEGVGHQGRGTGGEWSTGRLGPYTCLLGHWVGQRAGTGVGHVGTRARRGTRHVLLGAAQVGAGSRGVGYGDGVEGRGACSVMPPRAAQGCGVRGVGEPVVAWAKMLGSRPEPGATGLRVVVSRRAFQAPYLLLPASAEAYPVRYPVHQAPPGGDGRLGLLVSSRKCTAWINTQALYLW